MGDTVSTYQKYAPAVVAIPLIIAACTSDRRAYEAPSGNVLKLEVLSAEQVTAREAKVSVCYELPSDSDWVLGRLLGDVTLSDGVGAAVMDNFELLASSDSPLGRCDRLFFSRFEGFPPGAYSLTISRLAASLPTEPDWNALQSALAEAAPGLVIEPLLNESGLSFALIAKPPGVTDAEAHDLVLGLAEPVFLGPWSIPIHIPQ